MATALASDLVAAGHEVLRLWDRRLTPPHHLDGMSVQFVASAPEERRAVAELAQRAVGACLIAPENDGALAARARWVERAGGRLISPAPDWIELAGDKRATAERLAAAGVATPRNWDGHSWPATLIAKPPDRCGSEGVRRLATLADAARALAEGLLIQHFCRGLPASVALLCGAGAPWPLAPCEQRFAPHAFEYVGGALPLREGHAERARELARRAIAALPPVVGYVGVDLVLGEDPNGADDVVIEVNPRLTTSYVGLRAATIGGGAALAQAMLDHALGRHAPVEFSPRALEFAIE